MHTLRVYNSHTAPLPFFLFLAYTVSIMPERTNLSRIVFGVVIGLLVLGNIVFLIQKQTVETQLRSAELLLESKGYNEKALAFTRMFIQNVLQAEGEISFEDRLQLENAVRDLKDETIIAAWNSFVASKTEIEAQEAVKNLLGLLINRIQI